MARKLTNFDPEELTTVFSFEIGNKRFEIERINPVINKLFKDIFCYYFGNLVELVSKKPVNGVSMSGLLTKKICNF